MSSSPELEVPTRFMSARISPHSSSGGASSVNPEGSQSKADNPTEKKKLQNRIAQRSYRQRMKTRVENLQATVNLYERRLLDTQMDDHGQNCNIAEMLLSRPSLPEAPPTPASSGFRTPQSQHSQTQTLQHNAYEWAVCNSIASDSPYGTQGNRFPQLGFLHFSPDSDQPDRSPKGQYTSHQQTQTRKSLHTRTEHEVHLDQRSEGANGLLNMPPAGFVREVVETFDKKLLRPTFRSEQAFTRDDEVLPHTPSLPINTWKAEVNTQTKNGSNSFPLTNHLGETPPGYNVTQDTGPVASGYYPAPPKPNKLGERVEYLVECARSAGFDSFDALVTAYYTAGFGESSSLTNEQRLSRSRRLPRVVADVFNASSQWSDLERRGFHEEILKITESILGTECYTAGDILRAGIESFTDAESHPDIIGMDKAILSIKMRVQSELPNLSTLMIVLASQNRFMRQQGRSNMALVAMLLLQCGGGLPKSQILALVSACA
ncbi:hypothetical protein F5884DRAFT_757978 [Xylogone sp. PMI_703]|nr:hypothetical protein F5884DRAFT_757978 [Xylogone sp. PMI_703]